jgi:hypothetical protein
MSRIAIDITNVITPHSLFGIYRRIAYAYRKYHSGCLYTGVISGFAGMKLSRYPKMYGSFRDGVHRIANRTATCLHVGIFLCLFDPKNRGDMLLRNVS